MQGRTIFDKRLIYLCGKKKLILNIMRTKIEKCLFIISQLMSGSKSLKELNDRWEHSEFYDGDEINPRTFKRYIDDIAEIFKIDIRYNSSSRVYELCDVEGIKKNKEYNYYLSLYHVQNLNDLSIKLQDKIILPEPPEGADFLPPILEAMDKKYKIEIKTSSSQYTAIPCLLKVWQGRWYLIALIGEEVRMFSLNSIETILPTDIHYEETENPELYLELNEIPQEKDTVIIKFPQAYIDKVRNNPFHSSQHEIGEGLFSYELALTDNFYQDLLCYAGRNFEILSPMYVRQGMLAILKGMESRHK